MKKMHSILGPVKLNICIKGEIVGVQAKKPNNISNGLASMLSFIEQTVLCILKFLKQTTHSEIPVQHVLSMGNFLHRQQCNPVPTSF